jgi:hypothetical protein
MANETFGHYVMNSPVNEDIYSSRVIFTIVVTIIVHYLLPKQSIEKNAAKWCFMFTAYTMSFGILWLNDLTQAEIWS